MVTFCDLNVATPSRCRYVVNGRLVPENQDSRDIQWVGIETSASAVDYAAFVAQFSNDTVGQLPWYFQARYLGIDNQRDVEMPTNQPVLRFIPRIITHEEALNYQRDLHRGFLNELFVEIFNRLFEPLVGLDPDSEEPSEYLGPNVLIAPRNPPYWAPQGVMRVDLSNEIAEQAKTARMIHEARSRAIQRNPRPENLMKVASRIYEKMKAQEAQRKTI